MTSNSQAVLPKHFAPYQLTALPFRHRHFDDIAPTVFSSDRLFTRFHGYGEKLTLDSHTIAKAQ
ncbi:MAG: hypothetical protein ACI8Q3_002491 [Marinomonas primoryensis]|jgi:hypothetical protein